MDTSVEVSKPGPPATPSQPPVAAGTAVPVEMAPPSGGVASDVAAATLAAPSAPPPITTAAVCMHLFKAYVGSNLFLVPRYLALVGWLMGFVLMWLLGTVGYDCASMLVRAQQTINRPDTVRDYPEVVGFVFGAKAMKVCGISVTILSICWIVIIFQVSAGMVSEIVGISGTYTATVLVSSGCTLIFSLLSNDLSRLAWVSGFSMLTCFVLASVTSIAALVTISDQGIHPSVVAATDVTSTFTFISTWSTAIFGIAPVLPIFLSMDVASRDVAFPRILWRMIAGVLALLSTYGLIGYLAYGDTLTTVTLSKLPDDAWWAHALRLMLATSMITSIPMNLVPAALVLDAALGVPNNTVAYRDRRAVMVRCVAVSATTLVGLLLGPNQIVLFAEYLGATLCVVLLFMLPVLLDLHVGRAVDNPAADREAWAYVRPLFTPWRHGGWSLGLAKRLAYIVVGIIAMVVGLVLAVRDTVVLMS